MIRILFLIWLSFHPVHVSFTSLDYMPENKALQGYVRTHLDDLIADCGCGIDREKLIAGEKSQVGILEKYIEDRLIVHVNNVKVTGIIIKMKVIETELNIDLKYTGVKKPETITVKSLFMTRLYADQANMVIVRVNDFEEGVKLTPDLTEQTFKVN